MKTTLGLYTKTAMYSNGRRFDPGFGEDKEIETTNFSSKPEISRAKIFSSQISSKTLYFATKNSDGPFPTSNFGGIVPCCSP